MTPTTNTPTLLACLRAIAESGKTDKCYRTESYIVELVWKDDNWTTWTRAKEIGDWNKKEIDECLLKIEKSLIQIAKEQGIELTIFHNYYSRDLLNVYTKHDVEKYEIGKDGITSMAHALAFGLCVVMGIGKK